jgi:hypothetical protein
MSRLSARAKTLAAISVVMTLGWSATVPAVSVASATTAANQRLALAEGGAIPPVGIDRDLLFRSHFGLSTDTSDVLAAQQGPSRDSSIQRYGYALTGAEMADLDKRSALSVDIGVYAQRVSGLPGFAGFFVDQSRGGKLVLLMTMPSSSLAVPAPPAGTTMEIRPGNRTWTGLLRLQETIIKDSDNLTALGLTVVEVGTDVAANTVRLGVQGLTSDMHDRLVARYGPGVTVLDETAPTPDACISRSNCANPLKGGLRITNATYGGGCSIGFIARDGPGGNAFAVTAGHCRTGTFTHNGVSIGSVTSTSWYNYSLADAEIIDIPDSQKSNYILIELNNWVHNTGTMGAASDYVGEMVCEDSYYFGYNCGTISDNNLTTYWSQYPGGPIAWFTHQRRANFWVNSGDSGGPVTIGNYLAEGIYAAGWAQNDSIFGQIQYAVQAQYTPNGQLWPCMDMWCSN